MLIVAIVQTTSSTVTGVTFNGVAMTNRVNYSGVLIYTLAFPAQGTYNVTVSVSGGTGFNETECIVVSSGSDHISSVSASGSGYTATLTTRMAGDFLLLAGKSSVSIADGGSGAVNDWYVDGVGRVSHKIATTTPTDTIVMTSAASGSYGAVSVGDVPDGVFDVVGLIGA